MTNETNLSNINLNNENYFSIANNNKYMSVSFFKSFKKCEAHAMAKLNGLWEDAKTTPLLVGSYVDAHFENSLDIFRAKNPEIYTQKGELRADYRQAEEIIQRIENDPLFMEYMSGEKQRIFTDNLFDCEWKIKIDSYLSDKIVDLKVMADMKPNYAGESFVTIWEYDLQLAVYSEIERIATSGKRKETYLAVATKEKTTNLEIVHVPEWRLLECLDYVKRELPHVLQVKNNIVQPERCGVCDYCKTTKKLTQAIDFNDAGFSNYDLKKMRGER